MQDNAYTLYASQKYFFIISILSSTKIIKFKTRQVLLVEGTIWRVLPIEQHENFMAFKIININSKPKIKSKLIKSIGVYLIF